MLKIRDVSSLLDTDRLHFCERRGQREESSQATDGPSLRRTAGAQARSHPAGVFGPADRGGVCARLRPPT